MLPSLPRRRCLASLCAAVFLLSACHRSSQPGPQLNVSFHVPGEPAPRSLSDFRGRLVAFTVWSPGCSACDQQAAALNTLAQRFSADGLVCFAFHDRAQEFTAVGLSILHATLDPAQATTLPSARPVTILLDREGRIRGQYDRFQDADSLASDIEPLLGR